MWRAREQICRGLWARFWAPSKVGHVRRSVAESSCREGIKPAVDGEERKSREGDPSGNHHRAGVTERLEVGRALSWAVATRGSASGTKSPFPTTTGPGQSRRGRVDHREPAHVYRIRDPCVSGSPSDFAVTHDRETRLAPYLFMVILDVAPDQVLQRHRTDSRTWLAFGLAALSATSCAVALVLPYYAAGLPARESLYLYEIDELWPYTSAVGPLVGVLAFWVLAMAPFVSFAVASWCAHRLWTMRAARGSRAVVVVALLVSAATVVWFTTPLGSDLMIWMID